MIRRTKVLIGSGSIVLLLTAGAVAWWIHHFHRYTPAEIALDVRAALAVRRRQHPAVQFLETRYGPLKEPQNRQRAFLDFLNPGHIQGLQLIVSHARPEEQRNGIQDMAQWISQYRQTMTSQEKQALGAYFSSPQGSAQLQQATGFYLKQNVQYRAQVAVVISELLMTISSVQRP